MENLLEIGYYRTSGNEHAPELQIPIFGIKNNSNNINQVLIKDTGLNSYSWINVEKSRIFSK